MRIALVHDYLNEAGGAERVLRVLAEMYPKAPIYTAFVKKGTAREMFRDRIIFESKWGWLLKIGRLYSYLRFCLPWIWKSLDLTEYDIVITSCSGYIARGFRVRKDATVIAYCHTPPRWLYGYETPTGAQTKWWGKLFMFVVGPIIRYFDYISAQRVDEWIANSREVAGRIKKFYRRDSVVIYPPIRIQSQKFRSSPKIMQRSELEYYLLVSRIVGGKGIEEAIAGASKAGVKLKIVGEMVMNHELRIMNHGDIEYLGRVSDSELVELYAGARGFIALAHDEDFGMTVVEAMCCGTPVLAYNGGGYRETVRDGQTGVLIEGTDAESVAEGIKTMEKTKWDHEGIIKWAGNFNRENFERKIRKIIVDK